MEVCVAEVSVAGRVGVAVLVRLVMKDGSLVCGKTSGSKKETASCR